MRLATADDIRRLDERAEKEYGISRLLLMENAGLSVVLAMERVFGSLDGKRVTILCGKGGNGGDGMCAARHLMSHGSSVVVGLVGGRKGLAGEALANWNILDRMGLTPHEIHGDAEVPWVRAATGAADHVVDALVGVGARLPLHGLMGEIVRAMNESCRPVTAVDAPSGLAVDSGAIAGPCVRATLTVTLGLPKRGLILHPGTLYVGKLVTADLTFPRELLADPGINTDVLMPEEAAQLIPLRHSQTHKHAVGRVLVVAGSRDMTGAALLAAEGALVGGAGLVYLAVPDSVTSLLGGRRPELLLKPQRGTPSGALAGESAEDLLKLAGNMHALALGPGLGRENATDEVVRKLLAGVSVPMVVDADALATLAGAPDMVKSAAGPRVLTPHAGEMGKLVGISADEVEANRLEVARSGAATLKAIVVLKGARTVVAEPGGRAFIVPTGNPGMASGGTGDVLTGVIGALLAQRLSPLVAALLGAYVHGLSGDLACRDRTEVSLTASDVLANVPAAFLKLARGDSGADGKR